MGSCHHTRHATRQRGRRTNCSCGNSCRPTARSVRSPRPSSAARPRCATGWRSLAWRLSPASTALQHGGQRKPVRQSRRSTAQSTASRVMCGATRDTRCAQCRSAQVSERRRRIKRLLLDEAGGACLLCGSDRCIAALHFHHLDPSAKSFALGVTGVTRSLAAARAEAASAWCCAPTATPKSRAAWPMSR
jgi:hypothetical protein